jgi:hypothetical protein
VLQAAVDPAETAGGRLNPPLLAVLNEAANVCRTADLRKAFDRPTAEPGEADPVRATRTGGSANRELTDGLRSVPPAPRAPSGDTHQLLVPGAAEAASTRKGTAGAFLDRFAGAS